MKKILFLVSGRGGNLKFISYLIANKILSDVRLIVIADRECPAIDFAKKNNLENHMINYSRKRPANLFVLAKSFNPDLVVTTWHKILDDNFVMKFKGKIINLHYSLLPSFSGMIGLNPVKEAIKKCFFTGVTCHHVTADLDAGPAIVQAIVKIGDKYNQKMIFDEVFMKGAICLLYAAIKISKIQFLEGLSLNEEKIGSPYNDFSPSLGSKLKYVLSVYDEWIPYIRN